MLRLLILILSTLDAVHDFCRYCRRWLIRTLHPRLKGRLPACLDIVLYELIDLAIEILFLVSYSLVWLEDFLWIVVRFWVRLRRIFVGLSWQIADLVRFLAEKSCFVCPLVCETAEI